MRKLLITGASGFLGSRLVSFFREKSFYEEKYEVLAPTHEEMDICDEAGAEAFFIEKQPEIVIHCAAVSDTGRCEREPEWSERINVDGAVHVAKAAAKISAKCILCSSDQVYFGSREQGAHRETEILQPANVYGKQKLWMEERCLMENPDCVLLRLSWMYDKETKNVAEHGDFLRTLLEKLKTEDPLVYPICDTRGITDVMEVVKNLEQTFMLPGGVYNFGSPNTASMYETMCEVFRELGWNTDRICRNEEAFRENPRNLAMDQGKLAAAGIHFTDTKKQLVRNLQCFSK